MEEDKIIGKIKCPNCKNKNAKLKKYLKMIDVIDKEPIYDKRYISTYIHCKKCGWMK